MELGINDLGLLVRAGMGWVQECSACLLCHKPHSNLSNRACQALCGPPKAFPSPF